MDIYTFKNPRPQHFSLPYPIMKYILKNASPEAWKKLIKTCKYFFSKNPVFPISILHSDGYGKWNGDRGIIDTNQPIVKFWLYKSLYVTPPAAISSLIPKLSKCSVQGLLIQGQNLTFDEYQLLTTSGLVTSFSFFESTVKYSDGKTVTFDKLLENLKNVEYITVDFADPTMFDPDTVENMVEIIPNLKKLYALELFHLTETFDISSFTHFILKNQTVKAYIKFDATISDEFKQEIEKCCQKIIKNPLKSKVWIWYPGMNYFQYVQLQKLYYGE